MCTLCQLRPLPSPLAAPVPGLRTVLESSDTALVAASAWGVLPEAVAADLAAVELLDHTCWFRLDLAAAEPWPPCPGEVETRPLVVLECTGPTRRLPAALATVQAQLGPRVVRVVIVHARVGWGRRGDLLGCGPATLPAIAERWPGAARDADERPALALTASLAADAGCPGAMGALAAGRRAPRHLADAVVATLGPPERHALAHARSAGFWHPDLDPSVDVVRIAPFMVALEEGWFQLRPAWRHPLGARLGQPTRHARPARPCVLTATEDTRTTSSFAPPLVAAPAVAPVPAPAEEPVMAPMAVTPATVNGPTAPRVDVRLFGRFEVAIDGRPVERWRGTLPWSLLAFVLSRPDTSASRDALGQVFWPDVDPEQLRNRLHVAISSVRRSLRSAGGVGLLAYTDGRYRIAPDIDLTLDTAMFDAVVREGRRIEAAGDDEAAATAFRRAAQLHRDLFLVDAPFEEWTHLPRESYRLAYLDVLERLAGSAYRRGDLDECMLVGQRMLELDACNEMAHRLLMRAHAALGRSHEALRQFDRCRRVLHANLALAPSAATMAVYRELRAQAEDPA